LSAVASKSLSRVEARQKSPKKPVPNVKGKGTGSNLVATEQQQQLSQLSALAGDATSCSEKCYTPDVFSGEHVSELMAQNAALKNKVGT